MTRNAVRGKLAACLGGASVLLFSCSSDSSSVQDGPPSSEELLNAGAGRDGLPGWNIMSSEYEEPHDLDAISFEWDYFMVHDERGEFTGSVGYLFANPRDAGGLGDLLPTGGNAAVAGLFSDGSRVADYQSFGLENASASGSERAFEATDEATGHFARMTPMPGESTKDDTLLLEGQTEGLAWSLRVSQDWPALSANPEVFAPMQGRDVGTMSDDEVWNVNMLWPRTRVTGTVTRLSDGKEIAVDGHGYRENSWGRWAFNFGGWDFAVVSDQDASVSFAWQSYHAKSTELDYVDLGFVEDGQVELIQFHAADGELGWEHPSWTFDAEARVCVPTSTRIVAQNDQYRVEAHADLGDRQVPMLSDATPATDDYVIMIQFPWVEGTITRLEDGTEIASFSGQGGGEFSNARSDETSMTDAECEEWGASFASTKP